MPENEPKRDENCVFCKIVGGIIPSKKVFEKEGILAIEDIKPISEGHTVVLSVNHYSSISEMPDDEKAKLFNKTVELAGEIKSKIGADGFNLLICEGEAAQSTVPHRPHIHIVPRKFGDDLHIDPRT